MSTIFNIDTTGFDNVMRLEFSALSQNEAFARVAVAAFVAQLDPTINEITDIKTAVSEAVTNAIIHGYGNRGDIGGTVYITCGIRGRVIDIYVWDSGTGIADVAEARMPLYTSKPEMERSGMGFTVMETFMDDVFVESQLGDGTLVHMVKEMDD